LHLSKEENGCILCSEAGRTGKRKKFKIKHVIPLTHLWLGDEVDIFRTDNSSASRSIYLYWPMGNAVATFRSMEQTIWWYFFLQRSIREVKKQNKIDLSMQILTEDIACSDTPLYVPATNFDTGNDIISKLLPMMTKHNIEDYQLWFCPGHGKAPRPLQGHEYPHDIMMINVQKNFRPQELRNFTSINSLPQLFKKYLTSDAQGQFILKPRDSERILQEKNINGKTLKKPKTSITSWWHRYSVRHQDQVCSSPRVNKGGKLFGRELSSICHDNKLPSAILDMLSLLKRKGPTTKGVFTVSPSVTLRQTVKDKLDSDEEVDMNKQSVHVVAWIFKDFLQNIEGSLMTSKLYDEWISVTEKINEEEKLAAVQSLLEKLPTANAALLGQLFQILFEVKSNSSVNGMSSYQLSCGIAPCLLFMPSSCNNGGTNDIAKKISLTTFMIENARKLFGEDLVEVWYETSLFHPPGEKSSRSQNTATNTSTMKEVERGHSSCPSGKTCTHGYDALPRSAADHHPYEGITDSEKHKGSSIYASPPVPYQNLPHPKKKCYFGKSLTSIFEDKKMSAYPYPTQDMLSIIAEKGQDSDDIFKIIPENSHYSLRNRIDNKQYINWNQENVIIIASVLTDFIRSIDGSLLTSDLYENWLSVLDEGTVIEKVIAIQSLLLKIPTENLILLNHLISVLAIIKDSSMNNLDSDKLALRIAPYLLRDETTRNSPFLQDISRKTLLIQVMIDNYLLIFGNDKTYLKKTDKRVDGLKTSTHSIKSAEKSPIMKEAIGGHNEKSWNDEKLNISHPILCIMLRKYTKTKIPWGRELNTQKCIYPYPTQDMMSIIAEKGQDSDDIFKIIPENSHWSLRNKIDSEQYINWNQESVIIIASVLMNFIRSIDGSLLTSDLYENWFSVLDEGTVIEKVIAIQSLLVKIPPENLTLLYHLISVLAIIKDSSMNNLDSDRLALRIAPYLLRDETTRNSPFLQDISRKMSIIQIMIDNYLLIFGNYPTYGKHIDKRSDGLKTSTDSIKFADKSPIIEEFIVGINGKSCDNDENFNISYAALKKEGPTGMKRFIYSASNFPLFRFTIQDIVVLQMCGSLIMQAYPYPTQDMLSIIAKKGQESDDLFKIVHENSHFSLRNRIDSEQCIDWNVESVLDIASVFKDFIKNIDGSLLTSDLYENWLSVMDEGTVAGRITAIQRLLLRIPQENFSVLNHLISVLVIIKDSSMNNLNSKRLSIRIAPYALWDRTRRGSLFGSDMSIKISLMQIMIDNYIPIFENYNKYCSDGLKTSADFINSSGKSPIMKEVIGDHNGKTCKTTTTYKW
uniref:Rho-GAP domain-containing protein n=1 Tax=Rattus norvegicus TaxID=10116 RepID=D3ZH11_RAT